ncbi:MAG TPA: MoxR family ATPase [Solirubrobacterales bacterium]|nr:MoxR family ATPase [Solirubrobacterales bacterium]
MTAPAHPESVADARSALAEVGYLADEPAALVSYLAQRLGKPVLVEGPAGVGKTELAKAIARATGRELIRLQCYEGLDEAKALYEWNYRKQLLRIQAGKQNPRPSDDPAAPGRGSSMRSAQRNRAPDESVAVPAAPDMPVRRRNAAAQEHPAGAGEEADLAAPGREAEEATGIDSWEEIFSEEFLLTRPLLAAIVSTEPVVLLIDEIDKTDQEFEAMLLEVLSDFQISIPELGVIEARTRPVVVLTSNNTRELTEALKRRCLYLWLDYPAVEREMEIIRLHVPDLDERLGRRLVEVVHMVRGLDLKKPPSIAESIDWARALVLLGAEQLDADVLERTMSIIVKHRSDIDLVAERVGVRLARPELGTEAAG